MTHAETVAALGDALLSRVLDGPAATTPALRQAAAGGADVPADLEALVRKIHRHAYKVTDDDIRALQPTHSDDELFEVIVSAAVGAARERLRIGLGAIEEAR